jgi:hypothetical protein
MFLFVRRAIQLDISSYPNQQEQQQAGWLACQGRLGTTGGAVRASGVTSSPDCFRARFRTESSSRVTFRFLCEPSLWLVIVVESSNDSSNSRVVRASNWPRKDRIAYRSKL